MEFLQGRIQPYRWGSRSAIPHLFGYSPAVTPVAELWFGAHPSAPSYMTTRPGRHGYYPPQSTDSTDASVAPDVTSSEVTLADFIDADPQRFLGDDIIARYGAQLPFLLKVIAPSEPLSLQVHPSQTQAVEGFQRESAAGIGMTAPQRCYPDRNHKPEMVYALSSFEALVGFRSPRRILQVLAGLDCAIARQIAHVISGEPTSAGVGRAFEMLLAAQTRPNSEQIAELVQACAQRSASTSSSPRADALVTRIAQVYPDDPGVVASLLLNPVTLRPGETLYTPAGIVHSYISGLAVEVMAASDNVLRAGLTDKHMDIPELLRITQTVAAPPIRIAAERLSSVQSTFYVPVDDFELSVISLRDTSHWESIRGWGPRIFLCIGGAGEVRIAGRDTLVNTGQAFFVGADDGAVAARGVAKILQVAAP